jgi:uroporphyrinogen decarboxylase
MVMIVLSSNAESSPLAHHQFIPPARIGRRMTPKERFLAALELRGTDRVPTMYQHLGGSFHLQDKTGISLVDGLQEASDHKRLCLAALSEFGFDNVMVGWGDLLAEAEAFGVKAIFREHREYPRGQELPLEMVQQLEPVDPWRGSIWSVQLRAAKELVEEVGTEVMVIGAMNDPFLVASAIRGYEQLLLDQLVDPPGVLRLVGTVLATLKEGARVMREECGLEVVFLEDGLADSLQNDLSSSVKFDIPFAAELVGHMRHLGLKVILSNCAIEGYVKEQYRDCLPDAMHIASEAGSYPRMVEAIRGERCLVSGISTLKKILPMAPDEIEMEARKLIDSFGELPGHIIATGGEIPMETPPENIVALAQATR